MACGVRAAQYKLALHLHLLHVIDFSWACETSYRTMAPVFEIRLFALSVAFVERACSFEPFVSYWSKAIGGTYAGGRKRNFFFSRF